MTWITLDFNTELTSTLNEVAPEKVISTSVHPTQPRYDDFVKNQHQIVRNREQKWWKYQTDALWAAYKVERNIYNMLLAFWKRQVLSQKIKQAKGDTRQLFKIVNTIAGKSSVNPLLEHTDDQQLAEDFADFFLNKTEKIHETFHNAEPYQASLSNIPQFRQFSSMTESEVQTIIN